MFRPLKGKCYHALIRYCFHWLALLKGKTFTTWVKMFGSQLAYTLSTLRVILPYFSEGISVHWVFLSAFSYMVYLS